MNDEKQSTGVRVPSILRLAVAGVLLLAGLLGAWFLDDFQDYLDQPMFGGTGSWHQTVAPGATLGQLSAELATRHGLPHPEYLLWYGRWSGLAEKIRAGEYQIPAATTPRQFLQILVGGKVIQYALGFPEGLNFPHWIKLLQQEPRLANSLKGLDEKAILERLGLGENHPEGLFFPDTYHYTRATTGIDILRRAYERMQQVLAEEWQKRASGLPLNSPYEALILASIVEKETARPEERAQIAGVFIRRIEKNMRLETDPTVIYGLGESFDGNLRRHHLREDTPYNTYRRKGLPPTPIAMPGRAALHAVLHPAPGDALYFVARGDGTHQFSSSYPLHQQAVNRYQRRRKRVREQSDGQ